MRHFARVQTQICGSLAFLALLTLNYQSRADDWGSIKGKVIFGGEKVPVPEEMALVPKSPDAKACLGDKKELISEEWIVDPKTKGLKWVCVYLVPDSRKEADLIKPIPIHPALQKKKLDTVVVDQPCCQFNPYVIALQQGQKIRAKNTMTIPHNVKIDGDPKKGNPILNQQLAPNTEIETDAWKAQIFPAPVSCSVHGWMKGYIRVFSHPYFMVTTETGEFEIKDAPAGKYRLVIWHPGAGYLVGDKDKDPDKFGMQIEIKAGETTNLGTIKAMPAK